MRTSVARGLHIADWKLLSLLRSFNCLPEEAATELFGLLQEVQAAVQQTTLQSFQELVSCTGGKGSAKKINRWTVKDWVDWYEIVSPICCFTSDTLMPALQSCITTCRVRQPA